MISKNEKGGVGEIAREEVRILWVNDFYDGPLQGVAEFRGNRYLFDIRNCDALGTADEDRTYWLISLTPEQLSEEEAWQDLFCRKVGTHFDYTGRAAPAKDEICLNEFYDAFRQRTPPDYRRNAAIGWFRL